MTFASNVPSGSVTESGIPARAARWTTASQPATATADRLGVRERGDDELAGLSVEVGAVADRQVVEDPHRDRRRRQPADEGGADEAGAAGDEDPAAGHRVAAVSAPRCSASASGTQLHALEDHVAVDLVPMAVDRVEHRVDELLGEVVRLEAELEELRVLGVVVVLLGFLARVRDALDDDLAAEVRGGVADALGELEDGELLGELVVDPQLAGIGRVGDRQRDALDRVADVEVAARLAALAVDGQRVADDGLHAEAVERGPEDLVVVEARREARVERRLVGLDAVHDALVEVGRAEAPDPAGEVDVVAVVDLRQVVERARRLGVEERVLPAVVVDGQVALLDVDVRACRTRPSCRA